FCAIELQLEKLSETVQAILTLLLGIVGIYESLIEDASCLMLLLKYPHIAIGQTSKMVF
ncbi:hypothetical protein ACJX0J_042485, partial [Zea mays]